MRGRDRLGVRRAEPAVTVGAGADAEETDDGHVTALEKGAQKFSFRANAEVPDVQSELEQCKGTRLYLFDAQ